MNRVLLSAVGVVAMTLSVVSAEAEQSRGRGGDAPAVGPRAPVGPDVPLGEAEKGEFAKRITVDARTAAAVQAACERAVKEGVPVVFLPAGEYIFDTKVRVPGGLTVLGGGSKTICRAKGLNTLLFRVDGDKVRFTRLKLHGADTTANPNNNSYGITISRVQNCRIDHCELLGFSYATTPSNECSAQIDHCYIHHNLRNGLGYGTSIYSGAYVLITDNVFEQNRHSLASNGALDWSSPKRAGKFLHKPGFRKTHWEFIHNRVGSNDLSVYELCAVDTHPGMDGTFVVEHNLFENLRHGIGIRDGSGIIRNNLFRNLRTVTTFRSLIGISIAYGTHNNVPVDGCMPRDIDVRENVFLMDEGVKYEKHSLGKAENITIRGKLAPETKVERSAPRPIPRLREMADDGVLNWRDVPRPEAFGTGSVEGTVTDDAGKPVQEAAVLIGDRAAQTDGDGRFAFGEVSEAASFVAVSKPGFELGLAGLRVSAGQRSTVNVRLAADRAAAAFLEVRTADLTHTTATLAWQTSEPTTGEVEYGAEKEGQSGRQIKATEGKPATAHRVKLTDLRPVTRYRWRVNASDVSGNVATSDEFLFSTGPAPDPAQPKHWGYYRGAGSGLWGRTQQEAHTGKFSAFLKGVTSERGALNIALVLGDSDGYSGANAYPAQAGARYEYSFWAKGDLKGISLRLTAWANDAATSRERQHKGLMSFVPTQEWKEYQGQFTMPSGARKFVLLSRAYLKVAPREDIGVLYLDDLHVRTQQTDAIRNGGAENERQ